MDYKNGKWAKEIIDTQQKDGSCFFLLLCASALLREFLPKITLPGICYRLCLAVHMRGYCESVRFLGELFRHPVFPRFPAFRIGKGKGGSPERKKTAVTVPPVQGVV